jgi:hypothetical protein
VGVGGVAVRPCAGGMVDRAGEASCPPPPVGEGGLAAGAGGRWLVWASMGFRAGEVVSEAMWAYRVFCFAAQESLTRHSPASCIDDAHAFLPAPGILQSPPLSPLPGRTRWSICA